ncbi:MAG: hypothetical protein ACRYFX_11735 [Janthinobacterium lividum]
MIRVLKMLWLLVHALVLAFCGWCLLGLLAMWAVGVVHESPWTMETLLPSICIWLLVGGYVVGVRAWWSYAKNELHADK